MNPSRFLFSVLFSTFVLVLMSGVNVSAQHTLHLRSGEKMTGEVKSINDGTLKFLFKGNEMSFRVNEIRTISFESDAGFAVGAVIASTKGVSYVMAGRKMIRDPRIDNLTMEKGIVVVEITINKYGNVVKAVPGIEGSTTNSQYLLTKAKQAAESAMFDTSPVMPQSQTGSITITF